MILISSRMSNWTVWHISTVVKIGTRRVISLRPSVINARINVLLRICVKHAKSSIAITVGGSVHLVTVVVTLWGLVRPIVGSWKWGICILLRSVLGIMGLSSFTWIVKCLRPAMRALGGGPSGMGRFIRQVLTTPIMSTPWPHRHVIIVMRTRGLSVTGHKSVKSVWCWHPVRQVCRGRGQFSRLMRLNRVVLLLRWISEWILKRAGCGGWSRIGSIAVIISTRHERRTLVKILKGSIIQSMIASWGHSWGGGFWVAPDAVWRRGMLLVATVLTTSTAASRYPWHSRKVKVRGCHCHIGDRSYAGIGATVWRGGERTRGSWSMPLPVVPLGTVVRILTALWLCVLLTSRFCRLLWKKWPNMYFKITMFLTVIFRKNYS